MKYYQLKKDLPTFKKGELFYISDYGNLIRCKDKNVIAYTVTTLTKFPNILKDWFEEIVMPSPSYTLVVIQKLENSIKALDERLKTVEEITERPPREDNEQNSGTASDREQSPREKLESMKRFLRNWIEKNKINCIQTFIHTKPDGRRVVRFFDRTNKGNNSLTLIGWPIIGLVDGATYAPEELLMTGEEAE